VSDGKGSTPQNDLVNVTINGQTVSTEKGRLLIDVAEEIGTFVPRFCYHPGMKSVAVCRMCLVAVEGQGKLLPACATPVADGMVVNTQTEDAVDAQEGMLEFLLINHPLDCPICDRAGECPLQDQTYGHGPGSSRYIEPKRTYEKALEISDLVVLDRERCVLCWRCVRFCDEISGDPFIQLVDRGAGTQILTFNDEPFDSYFSGNTVQICPVGALTSKPYRFVARPWDLETAPSVCGYCSVGCPITNESRDNKLVRCQALPNEQVNDFWICDKGRYGYHYVSDDERLTNPLVRSADDAFETKSWGDAMGAIAAKLGEGAKVGVISGGHLTTEDSFAAARLARKTLKTANVDSRIQDAGATYERFVGITGAAGSNATFEDLDNAKTIVWVGDDPKEVLPVMFLRLRKAALDGGARLVVVSPRRISLDAFANDVVRTDPGRQSETLRGLGELEGPVVVAWGPVAGEGSLDGVESLVSSAQAKVMVCVPHAGSQGAIDMGVHPGLEPGYKPVDEPGLDTRAMLQAAADGELDVLLVFGADLIQDFPDADLAKRALESDTFVIAAELFPTETTAFADVILPSAAYAEREGTFTNLERRLQKLEKLLPAPGTARTVWSICAGIARALGEDWKWASFDDVWNDIKKEVPTHKDVDVLRLRQERILPPREQDQTGFVGESGQSSLAMAGPGGQYPKGFRQGAPFQTGQNWPLSWELRAFEAKQRPGHVPPLGSAVTGSAETSAGRPVSDLSDEGNAAEREVDPSGLGTSDKSEGAEADVSAATGAGFVLLTGRQIYDEGNMVRRSVALRALQKKPFVEMNDEDVKALGLSDGADVTIEGNGQSVTAKLVIGDIVRGAVFVPYDQVGLRANTLGSHVTVTG
jgi:NADH-quinone oxidoreductase subunit G